MLNTQTPTVNTKKD
jgi:hypothetical protein